QEAAERNGPPARPFEPSDRVEVLGCPGGEEANEVALEMFARCLPRQLRLEIAPSALLVSELLMRGRESDPPILLLAAPPPHGYAQVRYLVKRLRAEFPDKKVVVGCWGLRARFRRVREQLLAAGADLVGASLAETRAQLTALAPVASQAVVS